MPTIRKSADLQNNYIETYEEMNDMHELYQKILIGLNQIKNGETVPEEKIMIKIIKYAGIYQKKYFLLVDKLVFSYFIW